MADLFLYGTLCHEPLLCTVLGDEVRARMVPADLPGHRAVWAEGQSFPMIVAAPGASARGVLVKGLTDADRARLDYYEGGFGYELKTCPVTTEAGRGAAQVYFPIDPPWAPGAPWVLADWVDGWGALTVGAAQEAMAYFGQITPEELQRRFPMIRARAGARARATQEPAEVSLRRGFGQGDVTVHATRRPYTGFFAVEERNVSFRRFDGTMSEPVERAAFLLGDVITVLPYDPVRDRVLVIEQFRFAPFVRGAPVPWSVEVVAGLIDPGETPEIAARRETLEEAGVALHELLSIGRYYPSPGVMAEYHYAYVGLTDLPDGAARIGGLDSEAEDIRGHLLSFDALMTFIDGGEADNAPLILSAMWLARHRDRLRAAA